MANLSFPTRKLGNYITRVTGRVMDLPEDERSLPVYGVTNQEGITITGNRASDDISKYIIVSENQLAYNPYRINVGSLGLLTSGMPKGAVSPAYIVFETSSEIVPEFLYKYLKSNTGLALIRWYGDRGGVRAALRYDELCDIDIPDLTYEQQVAALLFLEEAAGYRSYLHEMLAAQKSWAKFLRGKVILQAVRGKLCPQEVTTSSPTYLVGGKPITQSECDSASFIKEFAYSVPRNWILLKFGDVAAIKTNLVKPDVYKDFLHIAPDNIEKATGKLLLCHTVSEDKVRSNNHLFSAGQIVYSKIRPALRKATIAPFDGLCSADMYPIDTSINKEYLLYYMLSDLFTKQVLKRDNRVKMPKTNKQELSRIVVPVPPFSEQERIVATIAQLMKLCDQLEQSIEKSIGYSSLLMESILNKAFMSDTDNIVPFPQSGPSIAIEDWDMAAHAEGDIKSETQEKIAARLAALSKTKK